VVWRAAVKLAYDGRAFMGSQRQPDAPTVESETIGALLSIGAIASVPGSRFRFASRTDRGVSALGNVAAFDTEFSRKALLRAMNSAVEDVYFYAVAEVPPAFTPRRAKGRWYRYMLPREGLDISKVEECASVLRGRHDFRRFCKPDGRSSIKTMESIEVLPLEDIVVIDLRAREFLRNLVRRMVAAMARVGEGKASVDEVRAALDGKDVSFGLAPAEGLTLMDIGYGFEFSAECPGTMLRRAEAYRRDAFNRLAFADELLSRCGRGP
jgi:tRNA pseudouridine38-40 synthase